MKVNRRITLASCFCLFFAVEVVVAQQTPPAHSPQVWAALSSGNEMMADLKFLVETSGPTGPAGWKALEDVLASFMEGTDSVKPAFAEILFNADGSDTRVYFPVKDAVGKALGTKFLSNLNLTGVSSKKLVANFYQLGIGNAPPNPKNTSPYNGHLRVLLPPVGYVAITTKKELLPLNLPDPNKNKSLASLLSKKFDLGLIVQNDKQTAADQTARKKDFQKAKDNLLAGMKQKPDDSAEEFALNKALVRHDLEELERFIAESAELVLGWTTDAPKKEARLDFELATIPGSTLDASAKELGQSSGMFGSVPRSADSILSGRINFTIDAMRKEHALEAITLGRPALDKSLSGAVNKKPEQIEAMRKVAKIWFDMLEVGAKAGVVDGMIEVSQTAGEKANLIFGIKAPDGHALKGILELLPTIMEGHSLRVAVETVGDVEIHVLQAPESDGDFSLMFGKGAPIYVATGPTAWWVSIGSKSLEQLKAAIAAAGKPAEANTFLTFAVKAGPWVEILDARRTRLNAQNADKKLTAEEAKSRKDRDAIRKIALDVFKAGKDTWETKLVAKDGKVSGSTRFDEGVLKFVGSVVAKFSKDVLQ